MAAVDAGAWLQSGATVIVALLAAGVGYMVRRNTTTADAIGQVRRDMDEDVAGLRSDVSAIRTDVGHIASDLAEVRGYLAAVQGDHFARRLAPRRLEDNQ